MLRILSLPIAAVSLGELYVGASFWRGVIFYGTIVMQPIYGLFIPKVHIGLDDVAMGVAFALPAATVLGHAGSGAWMVWRSLRSAHVPTWMAVAWCVSIVFVPPALWLLWIGGANPRLPY